MHKDRSLSGRVCGLLDHWGIESKLLAMKLDSAYANETFVVYLQLRLNARNVLFRLW